MEKLILDIAKAVNDLGYIATAVRDSGQLPKSY